MRVALLVLAACGGPQYASSPSQTPGPPEVQPEWNVRAEENARAGSAYVERVRAAPHRAPTDSIDVMLQHDAMDVFRKIIAHSDIARYLKISVEQAVGAHPTLKLEDGGAAHENMDWYESATKHERPLDVFVWLSFRTVMADESARLCPGMRNPLAIFMKASWSSAYVRNDHSTEEHMYCRAGYPDDFGESVPQIKALVDFILADIDSNMRNELPATSELMALTPPYRASWQWRRPVSDPRLFGIF
jgi:hypothetical protein